MINAFSPRILRPEDANQNWNWDREIPSPGHGSRF